MGSITGASRVCFAGGQTVSPIVCAVLYVESPSFAILSMMLVAMMVPVVFLLTGQPMFADPSIPSLSPPPLPPPPLRTNHKPQTQAEPTPLGGQSQVAEEDSDSAVRVDENGGRVDGNPAATVAVVVVGRPKVAGERVNKAGERDAGDVEMGVEETVDRSSLPLR